MTLGLGVAAALLAIGAVATASRAARAAAGRQHASPHKHLSPWGVGQTAGIPAALRLTIQHCRFAEMQALS